MWQTLFGITNLVALGGWAILLLAPRRPLLLTIVLYLGVGLLCLIYAALFVMLIGGLVDPGRVAGAPAQDLSDYSISGIRALFQSDGGIVLGWTHYLAFDLFTGLWIARDADAKSVGRLVQAPILVATFFAGPIGLLAWLAVREPAARRTGWKSQRRRP
jgi:hypothetical protein